MKIKAHPILGNPGLVDLLYYTLVSKYGTAELYNQYPSEIVDLLAEGYDRHWAKKKHTFGE